jgi:major membrane immunogen (membrane-anchored lipoprotein)
VNDNYEKNILKKENIVKKIAITLMIGMILLFITGCSTKGVDTNGTIKSSYQETNENSNNNSIPSCH